MRTPRRTGARRWAALAAGAALLGTGSLVAAGHASASPGQTVTPLSASLTANDLVNDLLGGGVTASNVTYTGNALAAGRFAGMGAVGFDSGVILSTGAASGVVGPNSVDDLTTDFGGPGDTDLDAIVTPDETQDAAVLEFDFVPAAANLKFSYVFASEEYNEFVNSEFNDVFAFFVNGTNCATVPGTTDAVSVNTVNNGNPFGSPPNANPSMFRNNDLDDGGGAIDTEMDGLTTVFTCEATVNPNVTNHMKLAIADTSDGELDTAVFIEAESFEVPLPPACPDVTLTVQQGNTLQVTLPATDPNPSDTLTFSLVSQPQHGSLNGAAPTFTYTPNPSFVGTDSFEYQASDGTTQCAAGTVTINVTARPVAPVPVAATATPRFTG